VARLPKWRVLTTQRSDETYCVVHVFPDHSEIRYLDDVPTAGMRIHDDSGREWLVSEALQSGRHTYTVFCVGQRASQEDVAERRDLASGLLELARRSRDTVNKHRRRWKDRNYYP
jgi:hypothetical protein